MFDFLSYVRDSGVSITLDPVEGDDLIRLTITTKDGSEGHTITAEEVRSEANIDSYTGRVLDQMIVRIGSRKARQYANMQQSRQMMEREDFFKGR